MKAVCEAKTYPGGQWRAGVISDEEQTVGPAVVLDDEKERVRGPSEIHVVRLATVVSRDFIQTARRAGFSIVVPSSPSHT